MKSMRRLRFLVVLAVLAAGLPAVAGDVTGLVVDQDGPVVGAVVELSGPWLPKTLAVMTVANGTYTFSKVPAGTYVLRATFADGEPIEIQGVTVNEASKTTVPPINMTVETVEVTATAENPVEQGETTTGGTFKAEELAYVPTGRSYTDVLKIAPGVSEESETQSVKPQQSGVAVYGSTALESSYVIDGINTTSVESGRPAANINFDLIDRIEIKTGGYEAEYGGAQGAVVNVTTKTGTNEFSGAVSLYYSPRGLSAPPEPNGFGVESPAPQNQEISASLGGPIIKDKLFFFGAVSKQNASLVARQSYPELVGNNRGASRIYAEDDAALNLYTFKLSWQVNANNRLAANFFSDPSNSNFRDELGGFGGDYNLTTQGRTASLAWTSVLGSRWILDAQAGTNAQGSETLPTLEQRTFNPILEDRRLSSQSIRVRLSSTQNVPGEPSLKYGPYAYSGEVQGVRRFAKAAVEGSLGKHQPKFGVEYERSGFDQTLEYGWGTGIAMEWSEATTCPASQRRADGSCPPTRPKEQILGVRRCWGDGNGNCLPWDQQIAANAASDSLRLFAQDKWSPNPDLTVSYGVRWENQNVSNGDGQVVARIKNNIAPRLGVTWDVIGGGRSKLYFSAGRYYDVAPLQVMNRAFAPRVLMTRLFRTRNWTFNDFVNSFNVAPNTTENGLCVRNSPDFDYNVPTCWDFESADLVADPNKTSNFQDKVHSPDGLLNSGAPRGLFRPEVVVNSGSLFAAPVDPDLKGASTDEAILGFDWEFKPSWMVSARLIGRALNTAIEDMSFDYGKTFVIANPGGPYKFYVDPSNRDFWNPDYDPASTDPAKQPGFAQKVGCAPGTVCTVTNDALRQAGLTPFPEASRVFRGFELNLAKALTSKLALNASYLYSTTKGNYRGRYFAEGEERDPNLTEAFDVPALVVNTNGYLPQDRTHQVKLYGSYRVTSALTLGATYRYATGTPRAATTDPQGGSTPFFGPIYLLPRGSAGRNPSLSQADLSVAYDIRDSGRMQFTLYLNVFNVLNSQKPVAVDEQFLAAGGWKDPIFNGSGFSYGRQGRGEPSDLYLDTVFGNGDGKVTPNEWNAWALSLQGQFASLDEAYAFFKNEKFTVVQNGTPYATDAYPGFRECPASIPGDLAQCPALNAGYGRARVLEAPRSVRLGVRMVF